MIPSAPAAAILAWLATYLVHSTLLLGGAWLVSRRLAGRHPLAEEAAWRTAFFGAILTATLQVSTGWQPLAGALALPQGISGDRAEAASVAAVSQPPEAAPAEVFAPAGVRFVPYQPSREFPTQAQAIVPAAAAPVATASLLSTASLVRIWLLAAAALLLRLAISHWALRRRIRVRLEVVGGTMFQILRRLRAESGVPAPVRLSCAHRLATPIAFGLGTGLTQAEIAVPPRALSHLDAAEQESLLAHELAHHARRDPLALTLTQIVACLFFFQPLNWLARTRLRALSELLADEWAVSRTGRPLSLARCLAEVAGWSLPDGGLPVLGMADSASPLGQRIRRLLSEPRAAARRLPAWSLPALGVLLVAFAVVAPSFSSGRSEAKAASAHAAQGAKAAVRAEAASSDPQEYRRPKEPGTYVRETPDADPADEVSEEGDSAEPAEPGEPGELGDLGDLSGESGFDASDALGTPVPGDFSEAEQDAMERLTERYRDGHVEQLAQEIAEHAQAMAQSTAGLDQLGPEIARMVEQSIPRPEVLAHLAEMGKRLGDPGLSPADRARLKAEIDRLAASARPSPEQLAAIRRMAREQARRAPSRAERDRLVADARRLAEAARPSEEELREIRRIAREQSERARQILEQHRERLDQIHREAAEAMAEAQRDMREQIEQELGPDLEKLRGRPGHLRTPRPPRVPRTPGAPVATPRAPEAPSAPPAPPPTPKPGRAARALPTPAPEAAVAPVRASRAVPAVPPRPALAAPPAPPTARPAIAVPGTPAPALAPSPPAEIPEAAEPAEPGEPAEAPPA